jgi:PAS domain S-box-containing protein
MGSDRTSLEPDGLLRELASHREKLASAEAENKRLEADRTHLAAIVEGSRDAIWSWAPDGTIVRWNAAAQQLLGYTAEEMVGRSLLDLVPPERKDRALDVIGKLRQGEAYGHYETVRIRKDGAPVDVELTVSPILDREGVVVGGSTVCRDITERKEFEASLGKRVQELTTLYELTERLQRAKALPEIYEASLDAITSALDCEHASILLFDTSAVMRFVAWRGLSEGYRVAVDGHPSGLSCSIVAPVLQSGSH